MHLLGLLAAEGDDTSQFVDIDVQPWQWGVLLAIIVSLLMVDLLIIHRKPHVIHVREAAIEAAIWVSCGLAFAFVIWAWFGGAAAGEYLSGYLIEESLSIDNVFVWALILAYFLVPAEYQHRVLFWGIFGALVLRATFIFAGIALIERFDWVLYVFGAFLLYTSGKLIFSDNEHVDPGKSRFLKVVNRIVPSTDQLDGQKLFTRVDGEATGHATVRRARPRRGHRRAVRRRQRAGGARGQSRAVHRVLVERVRDPRVASDVLPPRRPARTVLVPPAGTRDHPRLRRREDARSTSGTTSRRGSRSSSSWSS